MVSIVSILWHFMTPSKYWERCLRAWVTVMSRLLYVFSAARFCTQANSCESSTQPLSLSAGPMFFHLRWHQIWSRCPQLCLEGRGGDGWNDRKSAFQAFFVFGTSPNQRMNVPLTWLIDHGQSRHSPLYKDVEGFDDGGVGVDEGNVLVRADAQLSQGLLHESWLRHLTHLDDTTQRQQDVGHQGVADEWKWRVVHGPKADGTKGWPRTREVADNGRHLKLKHVLPTCLGKDITCYKIRSIKACLDGFDVEELVINSTKHLCDEFECIQGDRSLKLPEPTYERELNNQSNLIRITMYSNAIFSSQKLSVFHETYVAVKKPQICLRYCCNQAYWVKAKFKTKLSYQIIYRHQYAFILKLFWLIWPLFRTVFDGSLIDVTNSYFRRRQYNLVLKWCSIVKSFNL